MPVWCQDEAGPYQAIPQPGATWAPVGKPARRPGNKPNKQGTFMQRMEQRWERRRNQGY